jgi:hypothetical protein
MKRLGFLLLAVATMAGVVAFTVPRPGTPMKRPPRSTESKSPENTATGG